MRYHEIFEDARNDLSSAREAQVLVNAFLRWVIDTTENQTLEDWGSMRYLETEKGNFYYVPARVVGLTNYPDLNFGFRLTGSRGGLFFSAQWPNGEMRKYATVNIAFNPLKEIDLAHKMSAAQWSTLAHEVTHYLDTRRIPQGFQGVGTKNPARYYNSPMEKNAFFQQGLVKVLARLARIARHRKDTPVFITDYAAFKKSFLEEFAHGDHNYIEQLSPENRRKFEQRLYKIFDVVSKNWPNIPEIQANVADMQGGLRARHG